MRLLTLSTARTSRASSLGKALLVALVVAVALCSTGVSDPGARFNDLGDKLMCTCGCGQQLLKCDHVGCTLRGEEMDMLSNGVASGQNDSLILQSFVQRYGATVLAAPPMQGFDLIAWIMPFAVSLLALAGTIYLVRHWARQQTEAAASAAASTPEQAQALEALRARIRRETDTDGGL